MQPLFLNHTYIAIVVLVKKAVNLHANTYDDRQHSLPVKKNCMDRVIILFVDDDVDEFYLFNEALEHSGIDFQMSRANNGNHLLEVLLNNPLPDLVIMDINMPYKDGVEALLEIRGYPQFKELPLIIYSTTKNEDSINSCYQHGANLFILKPNDFEGMVSVVKKIFSIHWKTFHKPAREHFVISN